MVRMMPLVGMLSLVLGMTVAASTHPALAAGGQVADCTFATLQADLQAGGDWYYAKGQCPSPIIFPSTITFPETGPQANATLTAQGNDITLDGAHHVQLFSVVGSLGLTGLTLQNGNATDGGTIAIYYNGPNGTGSTLTISNCTFSGNSATTSGGAIYNDIYSSVTISNSTFSNNSATNGGVIYSYSTGDVAVSNSTFSNNSATNGGVIYNDNINAITLSISNSTFSGNHASSGGAIYNYAGVLNHGSTTISNSTLSNNTATTSGGAIDNNSSNGGAVTVSNSTFSSNSAPSGGGGAIDNNVGTVKVGGTIVANSPSDGNCAGSITDQGYNLIDSTTSTCGFSSTNHDIVGQNPHFFLNGLQSNGGPTQTIALQSNSPAIDWIPTTADFIGTTTSACPATDQRGVTRPDGSETACDIGAFESTYGPTVAHITTFTVHRSGQHLLFRWRMEVSSEVAGFNLYAGAHRLNPHLILVHARPQYRYQVRYGGAGAFRLGVVLSTGQEERVPLG